MSEVWLQLLNGLFVGLSLALVASGLALVFGVLRVVNFAQGELVMLGAYVVVFVSQATHSFVLGVVAATLGVGVGGGLVLYVMLAPLLGRSSVLPLLATLALSLILRQLALGLFGGFIRTVDEPIYLGVPVQGLQYPVYDLLIAVISALALAAGYLYLQRAKFGIWLRAAADNPSMAASLGVPLPRVYFVAFVASAGLSALAGAMLAPVTAVYATLGQDVAVNAFIVVVAGGMGNYRGAAIFAVLLGEIQALGSIWFRPVAVQVFAIGLVIAILVVHSRRRPAYLAQPLTVDSGERVSRRYRFALVGLGVVAATVPLAQAGTAPQQAALGVGYVLLASAVAILLHVGGVVNIGMGVAFGAAAYAVAVLSRTELSSGWLLLGGAIGAAVCVGVVFGVFASVASGIEYMMLTFLTSVAATKLPNLLPALAGGANGLEVVGVSVAAFGLDPLNGPGFYVLALCAGGVFLALGGLALASQTGQAAQAAGRNPLRLASLGYGLGGLRLFVAVLGAALAGLAGWIYAVQMHYVGQDILGVEVSLSALTYALLGGVAEPILGSAVGVTVGRFVGGWAAPLLLLVVVYALPHGVLGFGAWMGVRFGRKPHAG